MGVDRVKKIEVRPTPSGNHPVFTPSHCDVFPLTDVNRQAITRKIDRLDHPDAKRQNRILDELSQAPGDVRPVVLARLSVANARVRRAILRWLKDHLNDEATLPLMRYVFDTGGDRGEDTGRSMAMAMLLKRARTTNDPGERGRLRAFAEDIAADEHPDVRRLAVRLLAFVGDSGSLLRVETRLTDDDESVRRTAGDTLEVLQNAPAADVPDEPSVPPKEFFDRLVAAAGPYRRQLVARWRRRPDRSAIAIKVVQRSDELVEEALRILIDTPDTAVRTELPSLITDDPNSDAACLALRLLAKLADDNTQSSSETELEAIRLGLDSDKTLNIAAACSAAAAVGLDDASLRLADLTDTRHLPLALEAAESLADLVDSPNDRLFYALHSSLKTAASRLRRSSKPHDDHLQLLAHLMKALRAASTPNTVGTERLHRTVFSLLETAGTHRPVRVTGIQLLLATTPTEGFDRFDHWSTTEAEILAALIDDSGRAGCRRLAVLLERGAPANWEDGFDRTARRLEQTGLVDVGETVVPLLARSPTSGAEQRLEEFAASGDPAISKPARLALRSRRGGGDVIDVEFIPRDES